MSQSNRPRQTRRRLLDRWRRRRERVPFGPDDAGSGGGGGGQRGRPDEGGAGVREPRRPKPGPSSMGAEADEPEDQHLDISSR